MEKIIDVDFIEIGTCDFNTHIETVTDEIGFSIEPIKYYLDKLPNKKNVKKINCAISTLSSTNDIDIYYIPEHVLRENNLPRFIRGCNSIGDYHYQHTTRKLQHLVITEKVKQVPISIFLTQYNIRKINYLKLDTEGKDCYILLELLDYLKDKSVDYYPKKIKFETNLLTPKDLILKTIDNFQKLGYTSKSFGSFDGDGDTVLTWHRDF